MVDWSNPDLLNRVRDVQPNLICLMLGLYGWEYLQSLDVEYAVISGRKPIRWSLIPYLVGRLCTFVFLLLTSIRVTAPSTGLNCLPGGRAIAIVGDIGLACCSLNLMIRTWVIWMRNRFVHVVLLVLSLGHWIVLALDVANLEVTNIPGEGCVTIIIEAEINATVFVYSLFYDFTVLVLTIVGLSNNRPKSPLIRQLYSQGIVYFVVATVAYITPTVFGFLDVEPMVNMTGICAICASMIASCRAVRILLDLRSTTSSETSEDENASDTNMVLSTDVPVNTAQVIAV